jgi:hypothetical protein
LSRFAAPEPTAAALAIIFHFDAGAVAGIHGIEAVFAGRHDSL